MLSKPKDVKSEAELGVKLPAFQSSVSMPGTPGRARQGALASFLSRGFPGTQGSSVPFVSSVLDQSSSRLYSCNHWPLPQGCSDVRDIFHNGHGGVFSGKQRLWLHTPSGEGQVSIPGQRARSHMSQLGVHILQLYTHVHMYVYPACCN